MSEFFNEKLLTPEYYHSRMSLFMRNSYGMIDRCDTYVKILQNLNQVGVDLLNRFNVFLNEDYFAINNINEDDIDDTTLDIIASIFCLNRKMKITYVDKDGILNNKIKNKKYTEEITLSNRDLLAYIQLTIVKNNFQGTNEELYNLYNNQDNNFLVHNLGIIYTWCNSMEGSSNPLECLVYFKNAKEYLQNRPNIVKMFYAGLLTVESLGIVYNKSCITNIFAARFDNQFLPEGITGWINGYLYNDAFYSDSTHTNLITGTTDKYYYDIVGKLYYKYNGTDYVTISDPNPSIVFDPTIGLLSRGEIDYAVFI